MNFASSWSKAVSRLEVFCKKGALKIFAISRENIGAGASFSINLQAKACNLIKKEASAQVFSSEFRKNLKNIFLENTFETEFYLVAAFLNLIKYKKLLNILFKVSNINTILTSIVVIIVFLVLPLNRR